MSRPPRGHRRVLRVPFKKTDGSPSELEDELRAHVDQRVEELIADGWQRDEARAEAERRLGPGGFEHAVDRLRGHVRARDRTMGRRSRLTSIAGDLRFAFRRFRRNPAHSALVVIVLSLGIGTTTAVFTVLNAVLLRPLPYANADQLAVVWSLDSLGRETPASAPTWRDWQNGNSGFEGITLHRIYPAAVMATTPHSVASTVTTAFVEWNFFDVLRPVMGRGRLFSMDDATLGSAAVVTESLWLRVFGERQELPARVVVGGTSHEVVGVLPDEVAYPTDVELWVATSYRNRNIPRNVTLFTATGRLAAGWSMTAADRDLDAVTSRIREQDPTAIYTRGVTLEPLRANLVQGVDRALSLVMATGVLMLLIACSNATTANLVRCVDRSRELAIRASLGASRGRIVRQLVVEQGLLAVVSGLTGLALAHAATRWLAGWAASELPRIRDLTFDGHVLAVAVGSSLVCATIAGFLPMLLLRKGVAESVRSRQSQQGAGIGKSLVATQVAMAVALLAGTALLIRSFQDLISTDLGFDTDRVATASIALLGPKYPTSEDHLTYLSQLESAVRAVPGVSSVGFSTAPPMTESYNGGVQAEGSGVDDLLPADYRTVSRDYFEAMDIPLIEGRWFDERDISGALRVTIVNRSLAERLWPGESPIGRRLRAPDMEGRRAPWLTIVGVVGDTRHWGYARPPQPEHYVPFRQQSGFAWGMTLVVRSNVPLEQVVPSVRSEMIALDPAIPPNVHPLGDDVSRAVSTWRLPMSVLTVFGAVALMLCALGVYTVFAFVVAQRTREIGVRMALGATSGSVMRTTLRDALVVTAVGAGIGSAIAYLAAGFARTMLLDGAQIGSQPLLLAWLVVMIAAVIAACIPAWRGARVHPTVALRSE